MPGVGLQHLWVCSSDKGRGQVSITSLHGNQPRIIESFYACDECIVCAECIPGMAPTRTEKYGFGAATVWMGTEEHRLVRCVGLEVFYLRAVGGGGAEEDQNLF